jgi:uncharacterized linocin/CFP29 family protein
MADSNTQLHWTDEQWNKVRQAVYEEARRARVAGNILPLYGPLEADADYVRQQTIEPLVRPGTVPANALSVQDRQPLQLSTLQVEVFLRGAQIADPGLTSALIAFRRAASLLARLEDMIILTGQQGVNLGPPGPAYRAANMTAMAAALRAGNVNHPAAATVTAIGEARKKGTIPPPPRAAVAGIMAVGAAGGAGRAVTEDDVEAAIAEQASAGANWTLPRGVGIAALADSIAKDADPPLISARAAPSIKAVMQAGSAAVLFPGGTAQQLWQVMGGQPTHGLLLSAGLTQSVGAVASVGNELVAAVSEAIGLLERAYHLGPFACIFGQKYFSEVQRPDGSAVLPQERILPFLGGGALLRSSALPPSTGLVIALGGEPIDLVVATDISVSFLQVTTDPLYAFRVYEKIALRVKQQDAIVALN